MVRTRPALAIAALIVLIAAFLIPALINRAPILYPDSVGYYQSGEATLKAFGLIGTAPAAGTPVAATGAASAKAADDGVSTARSVYYGTLVVILYRLAGLWGIVVVQAALGITAMILVARRIAPGRPAIVWLIIAATGTAAGAGAFTATVMPDVFAGLMILGIATYLVFGGAMALAERGFWLALVLVAILFHKSHLLVACGMAAVGLGYVLIARRPFGRRLAAIALVIAAGGAGHVAVDMMVRSRLGTEPIAAPFVLARMIGDGTAVDYLRRECPHRQFVTCRFVARMPMTENEFLWSHDPARGGYALLSVADKRRVIAEQGVIERGTMEAFGARQLLASAGNAVRQIALVGVREYGLPPQVDPASSPGLRPALIDYRSSAVAARTLPLGIMSLSMTLCYIASLALLALLVATRRRSPAPAAGTPDIATLVLIALAGVVCNGAVCGMISGVFDRYQGRVAWTTSFLALSWLCARAWPARGTRTTRAAPAV